MGVFWSWKGASRSPLYQKVLNACSLHTLQIHEFVLGHEISESFVGYNMFVVFKSIIDMQMI